MQKRRTQRKQQRKQDSKDKKEMRASNNQDANTIVCKIYANWCGHCKEFITEGMEKQGKWEAIIRDLETRNNKSFQRLEMESEQRDAMVQSIQTNCPDITKLMNVGFPTVFKIKQNTVHLYDDNNRETNAIVAWICQ